jgi:hypothetical protein
METKLIYEDIWSKITAATKRSKGDVAVAYFGQGASKLLPLKTGSTLVVNFSDEAVRCGGTCPAEVMKLLKKGVSVFSVKNLHAKVFVFADRAFVGSTNVSRNSAGRLVEAAVETKDRALMEAMRAFIQDHAAEPVTLHYAKQQAEQYKPPRFDGGGKKVDTGQRVLPLHAPVKVVQLELCKYTLEEEETRKAGLPVARRQLRDTKTSKVDYFVWTGPCHYSKGDILIRVTTERGKRRMVSPPARVIYIKRVPAKRGQDNVIFAEAPKKCRRTEITRLRARVGEQVWKVLHGDHPVRDKYIAHVLLRECGHRSLKKRVARK